MIEKLVLPEIRELLAAGDLSTLAEVLNDWLPADLADLLGELEVDDQQRILSALEGSLAAQVFEYLELDAQERLLDVMSTAESAQILEGMAADDRTALLQDLAPERAARLIALLSPEQRAVAASLLEYAPDSVGRLMTPDYVAVKKEWTVRDVLDHVRSHGKDSETLNVLYVVDEQHHLVGALRIRYVLLAPLNQQVHEVMQPNFVALKVTDAKKAAVEVFRKYDRTVLPVVDARGTLLGIVTIDDVLDLAEEEATREIQKFGGLEALDEPYVSTPVLAMVRKRASWLVILFVGEMLTATAMGHFESEIAKAPVLALFVPLIISSGGNSGSQAATLIIRALALGEIASRDVFKVLWREVASGLLLGALLGTIGFLRITIWSQFTDIYTVHWLYVAFSVALSLLGIVLWGTICGAMLPILLKQLGFDPATSSAPFVATLVDVTGIIIYFSVAYLLLRGLLL
jgi:magnesium transporter